jgi:hypothetical protein
MRDVRFERNGVEKAYGASDVGIAASAKILGMVEHGFYDPDPAVQASVTRLFRLTREPSGQGRLERFDTTTSTWVFDSNAVTGTDGTPNNPVYLSEDYCSLVSIGLTGSVDQNPAVNKDKPGALFIAAPNNHTNGAEASRDGDLLVRRETLTGPVTEIDQWPQTLLTTVGDEVPVTPSPSDEVVDGKYRVRFTTTTDIVSDVDEVEVTVGVYANDVKVGEAIISETTAGPVDIDSLVEVVAIADPLTLKLKLDAFDITPTPGVVTPKESTVPILSSGNWDCDKVEATAADGDIYRYNYSIDVPPGGSVTANFWYSIDGIGWSLAGTKNYNTEGIYTGEQEQFVIPGLGAAAKFRYTFTGGGVGSGIYDPPTEVTWTVTAGNPQATVSVRGWDSVGATDPQPGITWEVIQPGTIEFTYVSDTVIWDSTQVAPAGTSPNPVPKPTFISAFGDRLIALRRTNDEQIVAASADGIAENWIFNSTVPGYFGGFVAAYPDTRSDPIDPFQSSASLTNDVFALFRERSIMRGFETGNFQIPIGVQHWIEEVGTESPWSVHQVKGGIIFLGHDKQVYFLNEGGPQPIGEPIRLDLERADFNPYFVEAFYDNVLGEYWLGIPLAGNSISFWFVFSVNEMQTEQRLQWRAETADNITRPIFVNGNYRVII